MISYEDNIMGEKKIINTLFKANEFEVNPYMAPWAKELYIRLKYWVEDNISGVDNRDYFDIFRVDVTDKIKITIEGYGDDGEWYYEITGVCYTDDFSSIYDMDFDYNRGNKME